MQVEGRHQQLLHAAEGGEAGQRVEEHGYLLAQLLAGSEDAQVRVKARGARIVIAGAEMQIVAQFVAVAADDHQHLAVGLESDHAVDDVHAGFLQPARPEDVVGLVKARAELDQHGDLLAVLRRADERGDDGRVAAGAVERHLDREHVGVGSCGFEEFDHAGKALVGMMQHHVLPPHDLEVVAARRQQGGDDRHVGLVAQRGERVDARLAASGGGN